ncbi:MAG: carboxymuconolactone decarboxylase [Bdellovibrionales bacterium CG10_big_fil_rev_8_21_14_0_10_45_34]|nr:MAG: carboxymuconolactone decarboxylase [Bdellovibrionales bacterium CG10_big_fil_rev_8_21_14_0_10_45_34]
MGNLKLTKKEEAKPQAAEILGSIEKKYGFIPNLMSVLADSPATLQAYVQLSELVSKSAFNPEEQQAILLATSYENGCDYCVAAHSMMSVKMAGMASEKLNAIRSGEPIQDAKLNELVTFTREVVSKRGMVKSESVSRFISAGFTNQHVLEVLLGVAMKTLSNYANHLAETPLDPAFAEFKWKK